MASKIKSKLFFLILTLLFSAISTVLGQEKDSIKFSVKEAKTVVLSWENEPKYLVEIEELNSAITEYQIMHVRDSLETKSCEAIKGSQKDLIQLQIAQKEEFNDQLRKSNNKTKIVAGFGFVEFLLIIYLAIKP